LNLAHLDHAPLRSLFGLPLLALNLAHLDRAPVRSQVRVERLPLRWVQIAATDLNQSH
jgi:hypothetical protein